MFARGYRPDAMKGLDLQILSGAILSHVMIFFSDGVPSNGSSDFGDVLALGRVLSVIRKRSKVALFIFFRSLPYNGRELIHTEPCLSSAPMSGFRQCSIVSFPPCAEKRVPEHRVIKPSTTKR